MICIKCGHNNTGRGKYCEKCNSVIIYSDSQSQDKLENSRLNRYIDALSSYRKHELGKEDFLSLLNEEKSKILIMLQEIVSDNMELSPSDKLFFQEETDLGFGGMTLFLTGIDILIEVINRQQIAEEENKMLDEAVENLKSGNDMVNQARAINHGRVFKKTI